MAALISLYDRHSQQTGGCLDQSIGCWRTKGQGKHRSGASSAVSGEAFPKQAGRGRHNREQPPANANGSVESEQCRRDYTRRTTSRFPSAASLSLDGPQSGCRTGRVHHYKPMKGSAMTNWHWIRLIRLRWSRQPWLASACRQNGGLAPAEEPSSGAWRKKAI